MGHSPDKLYNRKLLASYLTSTLILLRLLLVISAAVIVLLGTSLFMADVQLNPIFLMLTLFLFFTVVVLAMFEHVSVSQKLVKLADLKREYFAPRSSTLMYILIVQAAAFFGLITLIVGSVGWS